MSRKNLSIHLKCRHLMKTGFGRRQTLAYSHLTTANRLADGYPFLSPFLNGLLLPSPTAYTHFTHSFCCCFFLRRSFHTICCRFLHCDTAPSLRSITISPASTFLSSPSQECRDSSGKTFQDLSAPFFLTVKPAASYLPLLSHVTVSRHCLATGSMVKQKQLKTSSKGNAPKLTPSDVQFYKYIFDDDSILTIYNMRIKSLEPQVEEQCLPVGSHQNLGFEATLKWTLSDGRVFKAKSNDRSKRNAKKLAVRKIMDQLDPLLPHELDGVTQWMCNNLKYLIKAEQFNEDVYEKDGQWHHTIKWKIPLFEKSDEFKGSGIGETAESAKLAALRDLFVQVYPKKEAYLQSKEKAAGKAATEKSVAAEDASLSNISTISKEEASEINQMYNYFIHQYEAESKEDIIPLNSLYRCVLTWKGNSAFDHQTVTGDGIAASKTGARTEARLQILVAAGMYAGHDSADRKIATEIKQLIDRKQLPEAVHKACHHISTSRSGGGWGLFLVHLWKAVLSRRDKELTQRITDTLITSNAHAFIGDEGMPVDLWEDLVDHCVVYMDAEFGKHILQQLKRIEISPRLFLSESARKYFAYFRHLLALERQATLHQAINEKMAFPNLKSNQLNAQIVKTQLPIVQLKATLKDEDIYWLSSLPIRESDNVLICPYKQKDRLMPSWEDSTMAVLTTIGKNFSNFHLNIRLLLAEDLNAAHYAEGKLLKLYYLNSFISYERMVKALRALTVLPSRNLRSVKPFVFSPALQFLLLHTYNPKAREIAKKGILVPVQDAKLSEEENEVQSMPMMPSNHILKDVSKDPPTELPVRASTSTIEEEAFSSFSQYITLMTQLPLTETQKAACYSAITNRLTLIQGPPGTGKTHVACAIIEAWQQMNFSAKILAVADSNVAADNLAAGLSACGVTSARVGFGSDTDCQEDTISELGRYNEYVQLRERGLYKEARSLKMLLLHEAIKRNNVIIATCIGSGHELLEDQVYSRVLIDECTQSIEPSNLVPLGRQCSNLVLIGDHHQLPPTILSHAAALQGLDVSLMERLVVSQIAPVYLLDKQRRMHPSIAEFPFNHFYNGMVTCEDVGDHNRPLVEGFPWPNVLYHVCFVDTTGNQHTEYSQGNSKYNGYELQLVLAVLWSVLRSKTVDASNIGILTPYDAQRNLIRQAIVAYFDEPTSKCIEVSSIDGFQGKEKDFILFSGVRSNANGQVGFLNDGRRMNVMLTRAKRGVIVFGDGRTLWSEKNNWRVWMEWAYSRGLVIPADTLKKLMQTPFIVSDEQHSLEEFKAFGRSTAVLPSQYREFFQEGRYADPLPHNAT